MRAAVLADMKLEAVAFVANIDSEIHEGGQIGTGVSAENP
jgi:hypothetical protein